MKITQIFYINLERRSDRRDAFLGMNRGIAEFRRGIAPEGRFLDMAELISQGVLAEPLQAYSPSRIGNAVSHKDLWERCVATNEPTTIAEDDAVLNVHFRAKSAALLELLPGDWDIVLWAWNFDSILDVQVIPGLKNGVMHFDPAFLAERQREFQQQDYPVFPMRLLNAFGICCYTVSPKGARLMREACFPLRNEIVAIPGLRRKLMNFSLDTAMNKHYRSMKSYVCFPPLAWVENDRSSSDCTPLRQGNV